MAPLHLCCFEPSIEYCWRSRRQLLTPRTRSFTTLASCRLPQVSCRCSKHAARLFLIVLAKISLCFLRRCELIIIRAGVTRRFPKTNLLHSDSYVSVQEMRSSLSCPATQPMSVAAHVCFASALLQQCLCSDVD